MTATATLVFRSEAYGLRPEFDYARTSRRSAVSTEAKSGHVVRRTKNERETRLWALSWRSASQGVVVHLEQLWEAASGPVLPMAYTPVGLTDADSVDVRFVDDSLRVQQVSAKTWRVDVELEEVF